MAPPEYPKIVVTPSSANTCTIISAPVIVWPASGCWMEGFAARADDDKSRILVDFVGGFAMASTSLAFCPVSLNGSGSNRYSGAVFAQQKAAQTMRHIIAI